MTKLDLRGRVKSKTTPKRSKDNSFYHLNINPFPKHGTAPKDPNIIVFPEKQRDQLLNNIADSFSNNQFGGTVILGEYGSGKTHSLRYLEGLINKELRDIDEESAIAIYVENPSTTISELASNIFESFGRGNFEDLLKKKYQNGKKEDDIIKDLHSIVSNLDIARLMKQLAFDNFEQQELAWESLMGTTKPRKEMSIYRKDIRPEQLLQSFVSIMHSIADYKHVFILIDEFEDIPGGAQAKTKKREYVVNLRSFIDENLAGLSLIVASKQDPWDEVKEMLPPFINRFNLTISLFGLSDEEVLDFVQKYLTEIGRDGNSKGLDPFTEEAIKKINKEENGIKRFLLQRCHDLIEEGLRQEKEEINEEFVDNISIKNIDFSTKSR